MSNSGTVEHLEEPGFPSFGFMNLDRASYRRCSASFCSSSSASLRNECPKSNPQQVICVSQSLLTRSILSASQQHQHQHQHESFGRLFGKNAGVSGANRHDCEAADFPEPSEPLEPSAKLAKLG
eukprot:ANDGO_06723.mRNA.1 hypothetical protein